MSEDCNHNCSGCGVDGCDERAATPIPKLVPHEGSSITKVIGIVSGKGGVGKSLVTSLLACAMQAKGKRVGIMDADVTGPSIPKVFGVREKLHAEGETIIPSVAENGVKMVSVNLMLPDETLPVAWRGPVVSGVVSQFFKDVNWGELDYLFVDMPPGTSDVALTVFQQIPLDGIITVSSPQDLVGMIVGKAVNLADEMSIPVVGLVENMAYFLCPDCGKKHELFGTPQGADVAERYHIGAYATLPIDPKLAALCDAGSIWAYDTDGALDPVIAVIEA